MYYISAHDPKVESVCKAAFPDYAGDKCKVTFTEYPVNMASYWEGGSRSYFAIVRLSDNRKMDIPQQSAYDRPLHGVENFDIPAGFIVVEHVIFCGKDLGLVIHARPDGSALLPAPSVELSLQDAHVLIATAGLKSSYAGVSDYRASELKRKYGYTITQVTESRDRLQAMGYLAKNKSITTAGRNAIENHPDRWR